MRRPILIANAASGGGDGDDELDAWCDATRAERRDPGDDLEGTIRAAARESPPFIAVAGGDGTMRAAAGVLADGDVPLLPVPRGTFNHFAKSLGIEDPEQAAAAARAGTARVVPIAEVNGEVFLNTCVVGWYPEMVRTRERLRERMPRPVALIVAFARHVARLRTFDVELDGQSRRVWSMWVGAAEFGLEPSELTERSREDVLDVRLLLAESRLARGRLIADLLRGRLASSAHLERFLAVTAVTARLSLTAVDAALDAEPLRLSAPLLLTPAARRLTVRVPR